MRDLLRKAAHLGQRTVRGTHWRHTYIWGWQINTRVPEFVCPEVFSFKQCATSIIADLMPTSDERKGRCHEIQIGLGAEYIEANAAESASLGTLKAL